MIYFNPRCFFNSISLDDLKYKVKDYCSDSAKMFYIFYVGIYEGNHLFKLGQTIDFKRRFNEHMDDLIHNDTNEQPVLYHLVKSPLYYEIEEGFKRKLLELQLIVNYVINGRNKIELFKLTKEYSIKKIMNILNDIIKIVNDDPSTFSYKTPNSRFKISNNTNSNITKSKKINNSELNVEHKVELEQVTDIMKEKLKEDSDLRELFYSHCIFTPIISSIHTCR